MRASDEEPKTGRMEITAGATRWRANEWEMFVKDCEEREIKPTDQIRRFVRDHLAKRLLSLRALKPEALVELERWGDEHSITIQAAAERILGDFISANLQERAVKARKLLK